MKKLVLLSLGLMAGNIHLVSQAAVEPANVVEARKQLSLSEEELGRLFVKEKLTEEDPQVQKVLYTAKSNELIITKYELQQCKKQLNDQAFGGKKKE